MLLFVRIGSSAVICLEDVDSRACNFNVFSSRARSLRRRLRNSSSDALGRLEGVTFMPRGAKAETTSWLEIEIKFAIMPNIMLSSSRGTSLRLVASQVWPTYANCKINAL